MLDFLRKYQRSLFIVVAAFVIVSFTFFGTFGALMQGPQEKEDQLIGKSVSGSPIYLSQLQDLTRFLSSDRYDFFLGGTPNFCNDGVLKNDFLKPHVARLLFKEVCDSIQEEGELRLKRAKRFTPYAHPQLPFLSASAIWNHVAPDMEPEMKALQAEETFSLKSFSHLENLYLHQTQFPPLLLKQILLSQQQKMGMAADFRLQNLDLSLFGFHSLSDWFGQGFLEVVAAFILNGAELAKQKGYTVSLEEARGNLLYNMSRSLEQLKAQGYSANLTLKEHLQMHGFSEKRAAKVWQTILLFRKYFHGVSDSTFIDSLPYQEFASFATEKYLIDEYTWPKDLSLKTEKDVKQLYTYLDLCVKKGAPFPLKEGDFFSVEEMKQRAPFLVEESYLVQMASTTRKACSLFATLQEVDHWQAEHWQELSEKFSLPSAATQEARIQALEKLDPKLREELEWIAREDLLKQSPEWIDEMLAKKAHKEKEISFSQERISLAGVDRQEFVSLLQKEEPFLYEKEGKIFEISSVKKISDERILTFHEAQKRGALCLTEQTIDPHFLTSLTKKALKDVQTHANSLWCQEEKDPLLAQFRLRRLQKQERRLTLEGFMNQEGFILHSNTWSPVYVADEGEVSFFYVHDKKEETEPLLEQIHFGKAIMVADVKRYLAKQLLKEIHAKNAFLKRRKGSDGAL